MKNTYTTTRPNEDSLLFRKIFAAIALVLSAVSLNAQTTPGPQPTMCLRACWGARAAGSCATMTALTRMIVHHTASASHWSTTSLAASAANVRGTQNVDMDNNGFCDIEYNWMIDKFGNIFEGRVNSATTGLTKAAHDGYNINSHGVSLMGYFHPGPQGQMTSPYNVTAPQVMLDQLYALIAWRMPSGWSPYGSGTYNGNTVGFLDGHQKVKATACPGNNIHPNLITENYFGGTMRTAVAARRSGGTPPPGPTINPPYGFDADSQGWTVGNGLGAMAWTATGWPGIIYADQTGADAFMFSPPVNYAGYSQGSVNVQVYPQSGSSASHNMQMFWATAASPNFDAAKSSPIVNYTAQNTWIRLNMNLNSSSYANQTINRLRLDFDQASTGTRWIVNHVIPQYTPGWTFNADVAGWTVGNGLSSFYWEGCCGWPGILVAQQSANDAYMFASAAYFDFAGPNKFLGGANDRIRVRVQPYGGTSASHDMQVFFITAADGTWDLAKSSAVVNYTGQNQWVDVIIPVGANGIWNASDGVQNIRIDFDQVSKGTLWLVDSITIEQN